MDLLLIEWGCAGGEGSRTILTEGYGMLRALCSSLAPDCRKSAIISPALEREAEYLGADRVIISEDDPVSAALCHAADFDHAFAIAPERRGKLLALSKALASQTKLLSCPPATVELFSDKARTLQYLDGLTSFLRVPEWLSCQADPRDVSLAVNEIGVPCVLKPLDGAGGEAASIIRSKRDIRPGCARLAAGGFGDCLVQKLVGGRHLSATFMAHGKDVVPLSINTQSISLSSQVEYRGGSCPYPTSQADRVWEDVSTIARKTRMFGLMGIDFVLEGEQGHIIEVNPRLTTSFIGLSRTLAPHIGSILAGSRQPPPHRGYAQWAVLCLQRTVRADPGVLQRVLSIPTVVSPPFPVGPYYMKTTSKLLVCVSGDDSYEMTAMMNETKARLAELHLAC